MADQLQRVVPADLVTVVNAYAAIDRRDLRALLGLIGSDSAIETRIERHDGRDEIEAMFKEAFGSDFTSEQECFVIKDGQIHSMTKLMLVGDVTGIESVEFLVESWEVEDGKVKRLRVFDRDDAIERFSLSTELENVQRLRAIYDDFARNGFGSLERHLTDDVVVDPSGRMPTRPGPRIGREQAVEYLNSYPDFWKEFTVTPIRVFAAGTWAVTEVQVEAKNARSEATMSETAAHLFELRDGALSRFEIHSTSEEPFAKLCDAG